jgi:hypothetical protein
MRPLWRNWSSWSPQWREAKCPWTLLEGYKRGAQLLALCRSRLKAVEDQVQVLEDGQLKPLEVGRG